MILSWKFEIKTEMDLFNDLVEIIQNQIETRNGEVLVQNNPIINSMLGVNTTISSSKIMKMVERNFDMKNLPKEIDKITKNVLENEENMKEIMNLFNRFDQKFNRIYGGTYLSDEEEPELNKFKRTYFDYLEYSGHRYYCPNGWRRYSLKIDDFEKYQDWNVAYHGTKSNNLKGILTEGLWASDKTNGNHCAVFGNGYYLSPSIEYCGHPRYAEPRLSKTRNLYIQTVIQCRVRPGSFEIHEETLLDDKSKQIDPNFDNKELEWLIPSETINKCRKNGEAVLIVYGIMTRITKEHPENLEINEWWNC